jgi:hypothetical protein
MAAAEGMVVEAGGEAEVTAAVAAAEVGIGVAAVAAVAIVLRPAGAGRAALALPELAAVAMAAEFAPAADRVLRHATALVRAVGWQPARQAEARWALPAVITS